MVSLTAVFCLMAGFSAAVAEVMGKGSEHAMLKLVASSSYLVFAVQLGALDSTYGQLVLVALALSWAGDGFLMGSGRLFMAGLVAFLLAHVAYASAFLVRGTDGLATLIGGAVMIVVALSVLRWLNREELPEEYRVPVAAYVAAIAVMVALALGTAWPDLAAGGVPAVTGRAVILGAGAFAVSDILVARHRFVREEGWNRLVGLPLYYAAQLLLAASV